MQLLILAKHFTGEIDAFPSDSQLRVGETMTSLFMTNVGKICISIWQAVLASVAKAFNCMIIQCAKSFKTVLGPGMGIP